jgi:FlaG/FlaF family flagellin (archaellin)
MKNRALLVSTVVLAFALAAWADKKFTFTNSSSSPAAAGEVTVGTDQNGNNAFTIRTYHLANPAELTPAKTAYVVWAQENGKQPENLGELKVNHDLEGTFHGVTPYKDFDLFITAEDNAKAETPSGIEVLRTRVKH